MLVRLASRLLLAPLGFVCGVVAALVTLALISSKNVGTTGLFPEDVMVMGYDLSVNAATVALLFAPLMGAPAIVATLLAEMFSIRSWIYHAAAGAASAVMPWSLAPSSFEGPAFQTSEVLAAGVVGGLTHWLIAGRQAGLAAPEHSDRDHGRKGPTARD